MNKTVARCSAAILCFGALAASASRAETVTLVWDCDSCVMLPAPTTVTFNESTLLFESFVVRWNGRDFDFTFPNTQPTYTRQWFWDALNGRPIGETAHPGLPQQVYTMYWDSDSYVPDSPICFRFRIAASGAGPRCLPAPHPVGTVFDLHETGDVATVSVRLEQLGSSVSLLLPGKSILRNVDDAQTYYAASDKGATCAVLDDLYADVAKRAGKSIESNSAEEVLADIQLLLSALACQ